MDRNKEAQDLITQAEKKKSSVSGFLGFLKNPQEKFEDASELYRQAANKYKLSKEWERASDAFLKSAECQEKVGAQHEAANDYVESSTCLKKIDAGRAVGSLELAVEKFVSMGRHAIAGKHSMAIAEIYETSLMDLEKAIEFYKSAASYYEGEDSASSASKARLKVAMLSAQCDQFDTAFEIFEEIARSYIDNHLLKFSAKEYFLKAGLCRLASEDHVAAQAAIEGYEKEYAAFRDTRENKLLLELVQAAVEKDVDRFTAAVQQFDSVSALDNWTTTVLLKVKKSIEGGIL